MLLVCLCLAAGAAFAVSPDLVAFSWAVERGDIRKVSQWLDEGLDPEFEGSQFGTGLMNAAWHGNIEMMKLFIARGANPRRANRNGEQPLQLAVWNGHFAAVKWLLENGAVISALGPAGVAVFPADEEHAPIWIAEERDLVAKLRDRKMAPHNREQLETELEDVRRITRKFTDA